MFHPYFQCFSALNPALFRLLNINDSSMKQSRITDEEIVTFTCSMAEFTTEKLRILQISSFAIKVSKFLGQKLI